MRVEINFHADALRAANQCVTSGHRHALRRVVPPDANLPSTGERPPSSEIYGGSPGERPPSSEIFGGSPGERPPSLPLQANAINMTLFSSVLFPQSAFEKELSCSRNLFSRYVAQSTLCPLHALRRESTRFSSSETTVRRMRKASRRVAEAGDNDIELRWSHVTLQCDDGGALALARPPSCLLAQCFRTSVPCCGALSIWVSLITRDMT